MMKLKLVFVCGWLHKISINWILIGTKDEKMCVLSYINCIFIYKRTSTIFCWSCMQCHSCMGKMVYQLMVYTNKFNSIQYDSNIFRTIGQISFCHLRERLISAKLCWPGVNCVKFARHHFDLLISPITNVNLII